MATAFFLSCGAHTYTNLPSTFASESLTSNSHLNPPKSLEIAVKEHQNHKFSSNRRRRRTRLSPIVSEIDNKDSDAEVHDAGVKAALSMLKFYKREISPILPNSCRYLPTCSEYSMIAYKKYGVVKGTVLTAWRLCRCNPLGGSGFDPPRWFGEESPTEENCGIIVGSGNYSYDKPLLIGLGVEDQFQRKAADLLGCAIGKLPSIYLGLPLGANAGRRQTWKPVIDKVKKRLSGWKSKVLSRAGRLVLIKSVLNSLPMYFMSLFRVPKGVVREIISIQRNFFWGQNGNRKSLPLVKWSVIQKPKSLGGLGVGDIIMRNNALLFKWWWRYYSVDGASWKNVISSIHYGEQCMGGLNLGSQRRWSPWADIVKLGRADPTLKEGLLVVVGDGKEISFWHDDWTGSGDLKSIFPRLFSVSGQQGERIASMGRWDGSMWIWRLWWRRGLFDWEIEQVELLKGLINQVPLSRDKDDAVRWAFEESGMFSVKSFCQRTYQKEDEDTHRESNLSLIWSGLAPPRVELISWFAVQRRLNTRDRLARLSIVGPGETGCPFCKDVEESVNHVFLHCNVVGRIWYEISDWLGFSWVQSGTMEEHVSAWLGVYRTGLRGDLWRTAFFAIIGAIWEFRNKVVFEDIQVCNRWLISLIKVRIGSWFKANRKEFPYRIQEVVYNVDALL